MSLFEDPYRPPAEPDTLRAEPDTLRAEPDTLPAGAAPAADAGEPRRSSRRPVLAGASVAVVAALAGATIAHFAWSSDSSPSTFGGASAFVPRSSGSAQRPSPSPGSGSLFSPAAPSSPSAGGSSTSGSASATAARVSQGLVDINTTLGTNGAAAGTGMVVSSDGLVFTNNHVISGATSISATDIGNGRTYKARIVGYDQTHDVAVIQLIGASGLKTVTLGNSSTVRTGQSVITIGNAGGVGGAPSVATGTVTGLNQSITTSSELESASEHLTGLIALNGELQPGDSGGSLVNSSGQVVGMDTAASSDSGFQSSSGSDFAIPINEVLSLAKKITLGQSSNTIHIGATALIGVEVGSSTQFGFANNAPSQGASVAGVVDGTPAASAGIAEGDTITAFDGREISSAQALTSAKNQLHPGDSVSITWLDTSNTSHTATITLSSGPPS